QDELDAFLGANMQHQSARELSRRASMHHADKGGEHKEHDVHEMGVDEAWDRLSHTLQGGAPEAYRKRASYARHEAAGHMAAIGRRSFNWKRLVAVSAIGIPVAIGVLWYVNKLGEERALIRSLSGADARAYETSYGQYVNVTLDDSTVVRLAPESRVTVPKLFGLGLRVVKIEGAAFFDVTKEQELPFEVRSGDVIITANRTSFAVRRYKDDPALVVHSRKGALDVRSGENTRNVAEGMAFLVTPAGEMRVPSADELSEGSSWVDGTVSIVGRDLRYALPLLKRWYGLDIHVEDQKLLERTVFISADITSKKAAIAAVEQSGGMRFTYIGENMAFQDTLPSRGGRRTKATKP
ncbi:MAG: FecR domain-containing protein, partial [Gemmatimonadota bacterium]